MDKKIINKKIILDIENNNIKKLDKGDEKIIFKCLKNKYKNEINTLKNTIEILEYNKIIKKKELTDTCNQKNKFIENIELEMKKHLNYCQICFDNKINTVIVPCGHTYCDKCIQSTKICFFCRGEIKHLQNIIYS